MKISRVWAERAVAFVIGFLLPYLFYLLLATPLRPIIETIGILLFVIPAVIVFGIFFIISPGLFESSFYGVSLQVFPGIFWGLIAMAFCWGWQAWRRWQSSKKK